MIYSNSKIINLYKGVDDIVKALKGSELIWHEYELHLVYQHYGSTIDNPIPFTPNTEYLFKMDKPTWLIYYTTSGSRNTVYVSDSFKWQAPSDLDKANFYDKDQEYKVYQIIDDTFVNEEKLIFDGYTNRNNLPISGGKSYRFKLNEKNEIIFKGKYHQNRIVIENDDIWDAPNDFSFAYLNNPCNVKIYEIVSGGGNKPLNINTYSYLSEVAV